MFVWGCKDTQIQTQIIHQSNALSSKIKKLKFDYYVRLNRATMLNRSMLIRFEDSILTLFQNMTALESCLYNF